MVYRLRILLFLWRVLIRMGKYFVWKYKKFEEDEFVVNVLKFYVICNLKVFNNVVFNYFKFYIICFMKYICNKKFIFIFVLFVISNIIFWYILIEFLNKWCDYLFVFYLMYIYSVYKVVYIIWLKICCCYIIFKLISFFFVRLF